MLIRNWRDHEPAIVHEAGIDWRILNCKQERYREQLESEGHYDDESACMEVIRFVSLAHLKPGLRYEAHAHDDHEEIYYIIKGKGKILIDGEERSIRDGDCIYIGVNSMHQIINDSDEIIELLAFGGNI